MRTTKLTHGRPEYFPKLLYTAIAEERQLFFYPNENADNPDDNIYTYIEQENIIIVYPPFTYTREGDLYTPTNYATTLDDIFIITKDSNFFLSSAIHDTSKELEKYLLSSKARINSKEAFKNECMDICPKEISKRCPTRLKVIVQASDVQRQHCMPNPDGDPIYFPDMIFNRYSSQLGRHTNKAEKAIIWEHT